MTNNRISINALVKEVIKEKIGDETNEDAHINKVRKYLKDIQKIIGLDLEKITFTSKNKDKFYILIKDCLINDATYNYCSIANKLSTKPTSVKKEERIAFNKYIDNIFCDKVDLEIEKVNEIYSNRLMDAKHYTSILLAQIESSMLDNANKINLLGDLINHVAEVGKKYQKLEKSNKDSIQKRQEFREKGKYNTFLDRKVLSDYMKDILLEKKEFLTGKYKSTEEEYIGRHYSKNDFQKAKKLFHDIKNEKITIRSITDSKIKEIYMQAFPDKYDSEMKSLSDSLQRDLNKINN